ncbi:MAG TPA: aromatic ring-hydroxylating dioxygenase subunit alpha [Lichenihabitans sp.]|jgi:Rieske 2Fe-2S family protein|nr:aromatic ring-hydroxylating dioxygenase subunit alpha [Lichenihabitans sp.]
MSLDHDLSSLLRARKPGFSLPRPFYTDAAILADDLDRIFYKDWMFAGHDCEIAEAGQFFTLQIGAYPIMVVRGNDGTIRAFHNSCRHRGSRICTMDHGKAKRLVCPYHQWSYDLDGSLARARHMPQDFDKSGFGLKPVHCRSVAGYIFVCVGERAPAWEPFADAAEPYLAPHRLSKAKVAFESTVVEHGNWKLVWENNRECFHCAANHPELCRTFPEAPTVAGGPTALSDPTLVAHWARLEAEGLPSTFRLSPEGQHRLSRMPLLDEAVSYTMSGKAAVRRPLSDSVPTPQIGTLLMFHYPSIWNHVLGDHAISFRVLPLGPTETQLTTKWLVNKDAVEGVDYELGDLTRVWLATNDQDRRVVEENQRGILSPAYEPGPYSPEHESGVVQFVDWYCGALERSLGDKRPSLSRVA